MSAGVIVICAVAVLLLLIVVEVPVGLALAVSGIFGSVLLEGWPVASDVLSTTPYYASARYALFVIPMFVLLGALVANAGIGAQIFTAVNKVVGRVPGGLPATTVLATAAFSGISGSSAADVAAFGRISVQEMTRKGYSPNYAAAVVAAAGAFAALIPPSIVLVVFAITADISVGSMILAGVLPGLFSAAVLAGYVVARTIWSRRGSPAEAHDSPVDLTRDAPEDAEFARYQQSRRGSLIGALYAVLLFAIVIGGIQTGLFTSTEAGAVGAFAALLLTLVVKRPKHLTRWAVVARSLKETSSITSMVFLLLVGAAIFNYFLISARVPSDVAAWVAGLDLPAHIVLLLILLLLLPLGTVLDGLSMVLVVTPIVVPIVNELGFDPIWYGILLIKMTEIALITPPVGINVFVIAGIMKATKVEQIFRSVFPFVLLDLAVTAVLFAFPSIITWLPSIATPAG
ncbi:TRAP transporter large permease [Dactylosporangium sp. NPDC005572]|uniref:TRAP transporter large permease n=1 Tax=Dactylosporangium sp. NPDC005572 TaxID=3156889 RepID=UPI0033AE25DF